MPTTKNSKTLPKKILDSTIREAVVNAIRREHVEINGAIKSVSHITNIDTESIAKWSAGKHTPSAAHFLTLAMFYPSALEILLTLIGRQDVWQLAVQENIPKRMDDVLAKTYFSYKKRGDIFLGNMTKKSAFFPNKRQLWFLDMLQKTDKMQNKHIAVRWNVDPRTAKRDTKQLIAAGFICSVRSGGTGWFEWTGEPYGQ